ncbi:hypothetical protein UCRPC4_g01601 [Phaeomoniella chlamydospora]|uniref:DUF7598 domain-containing protein n=1 Tax=Phaeomoniella chlamydospora TaxID=158046 RepID=A0A0G2HBI0_PHACM|nr:hypothetical protein UCRPC4_g01601 [Phaeomoniella chlamydospora]
MAFFKGLPGTGCVVLNVIRVMNIISLLAVIAASMVMLVKTFIVSKFFFFDGVSHALEAGVATFLIISELPLFGQWFINNWPLLGQKHGFVALGGTMLALGNGLLAYLNKSSTSQKSLGLAFWRIVISAGIVVIIMGFVNIFVSYMFRYTDSTGIKISAREVRTYGAVASHKVEEQVLKSPALSHKLVHKDSLPSYYSSAASSVSTRQTPPAKLPLTISRPINNDVEASAKVSGPGSEIQEPDLAHHPAMYSNRI